MEKALTIKSDLALAFGDRRDGIIGLPAVTADGRLIEASYFYGDKHPKNIVAISSQAGCPMGCQFCELGSEGFGRSLTPQEMADQVALALGEAARRGIDIARTPHKVSVANSGEPLLNPRLVEGLEALGSFPKTVKVSTVFPEAGLALGNFARLADFAAAVREPAVQIQVSLLSSSEEARRRLSGGHAAGFRAVREAAEMWRMKNPLGRKVNLSLMIAHGPIQGASAMAAQFPPELFRVRFREYAPTENGSRHGLSAVSAPELGRLAEEFSAAGYEVGDWGSPTPVERKFGLAANSFIRMYRSLAVR